MFAQFVSCRAAVSALSFCPAASSSVLDLLSLFILIGKWNDDDDDVCMDVGRSAMVTKEVSLMGAKLQEKFITYRMHTEARMRLMIVVGMYPGTGQQGTE